MDLSLQIHKLKPEKNWSLTNLRLINNNKKKKKKKKN